MIEVGFSLSLTGTSWIRMHSLPESNKHKTPNKISVVGVQVDKRVNAVDDVISLGAVSSAVHLPGDATVESSIVVCPVRSQGIVIVGGGRVSREERGREVRELNSK